MVYEKGSIYVFLASRSFGESLSQSTLQPIFTFFHTIHCKHVIFTILYVFPFQIYPLVKSVYIHKIRNIQNPLASRSFGESLSQSTLQPIFTFFHTIHCKHVIFTILCVFPFQIYPLVNTVYIYENKELFRTFLASRSFGESLSQSTLQPIFTFFHTIHCKHVIFTILYVFPFQIYPLVNTVYIYENGTIQNPLASRSFGESLSQSTLQPIFTFFHTIHCKHVIFTILYVFPFQIYPLVKSVYIHKIRNIQNPLASRSFGESLSQSTLQPIFTFFHTIHCKHVIFTILYVFPFQIYPLVKSVYIHKIGNIQNPLASRSFGESLSQSTLQPIFTFFHTIHCKHVIFTILYVFPFQIYPLVNTTMVYKIGSIQSFWHREVSGKVFLRALYSQFSHFSIQYIANMSFSQFCMYFRFKYTPS